MKHTELPWEVHENTGMQEEKWHTILRGAVDVTHNTEPHEIACDKYSALPQEENEANAAFIVKACNNHYQLLKLLTTAYDLVAESMANTKQYDYEVRANSLVKQAQEAIKQAEAE